MGVIMPNHVPDAARSTQALRLVMSPSNESMPAIEQMLPRFLEENKR